jgi:hypothetical protein
MSCQGADGAAVPLAHAALPYAELLSPSLQPRAPPTAAARAATRAAFAPGGTGLLLLTGLPPALEALRCALLARAPALPPRAALLAEHGLGSDTSGPGAPASATLQLAWGQGGPGEERGSGGGSSSGGGGGGGAPASPLRADMEALGSAWAAVCEAVAGACDAWIPGGGALAPALRSAREAKARLIFYGPGPAHEPWQAWHKDYGLFTAVSAPLYWEGSASSGGGGVEDGGMAPAPAPAAEQQPQLAQPAAPPLGAGLHVLCAGGAGGGARVLGAPGLMEGCLAVQVGEAAQILSGGALAAVPHCVLRGPSEPARATSRAVFVVFCQPPSQAPMAPCGGGGGGGGGGGDGGGAGAAAAAAASTAAVYAAEHPSWAAQLQGVVPPLAARWPGPGGASAPCTYAGFGKSTVKAYFGKAGTQSAAKR